MERKSHCGRKSFALLSFLLGFGFAVLLIVVPYSPGAGRQQQTVQDPAVAMAWQYVRPTSSYHLLQPTRARQFRLPSASGDSDSSAAATRSVDDVTAATSEADVTASAAAVAPPADGSIMKRRAAIGAVAATYAAAASYAAGNNGLFQLSVNDNDNSNNNPMRKREHGTCVAAPPSSLRWGADVPTANKIACFNRRGAEFRGYFQTTNFLKTESAASGEITFYDSITNKPLFIAPRGRSFEEFVAESRYHGWPSFRDAEVVSKNVFELPDGEAVSVDGTHLGHNLPDNKGNRYCIDLVSIAGLGPKIENKG